MATLQPIEPSQATGEAKALFEDILKRLPRVPNLLATLAHSPTVLVHISLSRTRSTASCLSGCGT
jgi:hypothetical protein